MAWQRALATRPRIAWKSCGFFGSFNHNIIFFINIISPIIDELICHHSCTALRSNHNFFPTSCVCDAILRLRINFNLAWTRWLRRFSSGLLRRLSSRLWSRCQCRLWSRSWSRACRAVETRLHMTFRASPITATRSQSLTLRPQQAVIEATR